MVSILLLNRNLSIEMSTVRRQKYQNYIGSSRSNRATVRVDEAGRAEAAQPGRGRAAAAVASRRASTGGVFVVRVFARCAPCLTSVSAPSIPHIPS